GAERAVHGTVIERDEADGPDLREARFTIRLHREGSGCVAPLQLVPITPVRHAVIRCLEDGIAKLFTAQGRLGASPDNSLVIPGRGPFDPVNVLAGAETISHL